jgi:hypothetical protein
MHLGFQLSFGLGWKLGPRGTALWIALGLGPHVVVTLHPRCVGPHHGASSEFEHIEFE